jgi:hypothetical protein
LRPLGPTRDTFTLSSAKLKENPKYAGVRSAMLGQTGASLASRCLCVAGFVPAAGHIQLLLVAGGAALFVPLRISS